MDEIGLIFFKDQFKFKIIEKGNGNYSAQGKIHFNGPLRRKQGVASIKLDLTTDEILVLKTVNKKVHHPYTDEPAQGIYANCYAFEEIVAEKIRALAQRARPRDVYDVVHFFRNRQMINNPTLVYNVLQKKCNYK
jgi:predicted nucleotidyltransferase component of viral defense system